MKVKFVPQNIEYEIKPGEPVLHLAQNHNIHIRSVCRGVPSCAECRVRVVAGENNVIPPSKTELGLIGTAYFVDGRRLSCQLRCFGDVTIDLTEQIDNQGATKKMRGKYNKDEMQESRAVMGNLIMNDDPKKLEDSDSVITPVAALGPDGVPTSEEDEIDIANDVHEAHLASESRAQSGEFADDVEDDADNEADDEFENEDAGSPAVKAPVKPVAGSRPGQRSEGPRPSGSRTAGPRAGGSARPQAQRTQSGAPSQQAGPRPAGAGGRPQQDGAPEQGEGAGKPRRRRRGGRGRRGGSGGGGGRGPGGGGPSGAPSGGGAN